MQSDRQSGTLANYAANDICRCSLPRASPSPCMSYPLLSLELFDSRLTFVLSARDGALPFSGWLYRMNGYTKTPVNTVWFCAAGSISLGSLVFAGSQAINAVFSISITGLYLAYSIPIAARWIWRKDNGWTPGAFSLGAWVSAIVVSHFRCGVMRGKFDFHRVDLVRLSPSAG